MHPARQQDPTPAATARAGGRLGLAGVVLVVLGLVLCVAYRFTASDEPHSYAADAVAPYDVTLTAGHVYHVSIHRGVDAEQDLGLDPTALSCSYAVEPGEDRSLPVTPEPSTSKATNVVATFQAPVTGSVHVACSGLPAVFVDDADTAPGDRSGLYLLLGLIALGVGIPLLLSALRTSLAASRRGSDGFGEHDQVE